MKIRVLQGFKFAHQGFRVVEYFEGDEIDTKEEGVDESIGLVAITEKWAEPVDADKKPEGDAGEDGKKKAAENKSKGGAPENKGA